METKIIEVNLGVGMDQIFPKPVKIILEHDEDNIEESEETKNLNDQQNG